MECPHSYVKRNDMSVACFNNNFGTFYKVEDHVVNRRVKSNGGVLQTANRGCIGYNRREGKSSNPIRLVNGVPWRDPSSYNRVCTRLEYDSVTWENATYVFNGVQTSLDTGIYIQIDQPFNQSGVSVGLTGFSGYDLNNRARARTECMLKLQDQKIQLGTYLAESVRSANLLADGVSSFARTLLSIKRRNWIALRQRYTDIKDFPGGVLQWRYGVQPLANDLYTSFQIVKNGLGQRAQMLTATRNVKTSGDTASKTEYGYQWQGKGTMHNTCKVTARLNDAFISNASRIGLVNPLEMAWEIVPWSFAVDWVMPIGNFLSGLSAHAGLTFMGGYDAQRYEGTLEGRPYGSANVGSCNGEVFHFNRSKLSGFPSIVPYVKSPFSTQHIGNAIALLHELIKSKR